MSVRVRVLGAGGVLGKAVMHELRIQGHDRLPVYTRIQDVTTSRQLGDVVINCAGLVKQVDATPDDLILTNAYGPHRLARVVDEYGGRIIHISTDCVFNGGGPHYEDSVPDGTDMYAISKRAGEVTYGPHLTVRTSFVGFGPRGLIHDLQTQERVSVSNNLLWSGHTVDTVARLIVWLVDHPHITGLLHVPGDFQTRYTLARDLKARWGLPAILDRNDEFAADRRLGSGKWTYLGLPVLPSFEQQLDDMRGPDDVPDANTPDHRRDPGRP